MTKLLITGGAGFIGSHTCIDLLNKGFKLIIIDSFINSFPKVIDRINEVVLPNNRKNLLEIIKGDIRNKDIINSIFQEHVNSKKPIEGVIHFSGLKSVLDSIRNPIRYWDNNVCGTVNLLNTMEKFNCSTIVFSSSASIYGQNNSQYFKESSPINPVNPYGENKVAIENILNSIYKSSQNNWRIANLRYFNPIGAHPSGLLGENPMGEPNNLFPLLCQVASKQKEKLLIFGGDYDTNDGTAIRDFIHVMDLAEGHSLAIENLLKENSKFININLGTGKGTSVLEIINTFIETNSCKIPFEIVGRREGDACFVVADNKLARSYLSWIPKRSLNEMCQDGWKWYSRLIKFE